MKRAFSVQNLQTQYEREKERLTLQEMKDVDSEKLSARERLVQEVMGVKAAVQESASPASTEGQE